MTQTTLDHDTTQAGTSAVRTAEITRPAETPTDAHDQREHAPDTFEDPKSALRWWTRLRAYWVPPTLLTDPPPSLAELASYAHHAPWTRQRQGFVRSVGIAWHRFVSIPQTARFRFAEWRWQRPGRLLYLFALVKLLSFTTLGAWIVNTLIRPYYDLVMWVLF